MRIGELKIPFLLQEESLAAGTDSGSVSLWTSLGVLWGKITAITDGLLASDLSRRVSHKITARYRADIVVKTGMRLSYNDRVFLIRAVRNKDEGRRWLDLYVEETVSLIG